MAQFNQAENEATVSTNETGAALDNDSMFVDGSQFSIVEDERWVTVVNSVTKDTLVDTMITQLETLSMLCGLLSSQNSSGLKWVEEYFSHMARDEISTHAESNREISLAKAKFTCAFSDIRFRSGSLDILAYEQELNNAFKQALDIETNPQGLCDQADAELAFHISIQFSLSFILQSQQQDLPFLNKNSWKHITKALNCLTSASKLPQAQNLSRIHLRRGDCELYRFRLGQAPNNFDLASKGALTLTKNAEIYYRGASGFARNEGALEEEREALVKEAAVASLGGHPNRLWQLSGVGDEATMEILEDMKNEGLLSAEAVDSLLRRDV